MDVLLGEDADEEAGRRIGLTDSQTQELWQAYLKTASRSKTPLTTRNIGPGQLAIPTIRVRVTRAGPATQPDRPTELYF